MNKRGAEQDNAYTSVCYKIFSQSCLEMWAFLLKREDAKSLIFANALKMARFCIYVFIWMIF